MIANRKVIFGKAGGNAGKNSVNYKLNIPADMIRELGVTETDREVKLTCEKGTIIIEKVK